MLTNRLTAAILALALTGPSPLSQEPTRAVLPHVVLPHRERVEVVNRILRDRLDNLLPRLMRETGIDMWVVINREYNEDPVYLTLVPEPVFHARRTTMLVFFDRGGEQGVERLTVSRYGLGGLYQGVWDGGTLEEQWQRLVEVIDAREPERIGVNVSHGWAFGDGLSAGLHEQLEEHLDGRYELTSAEALCVRWLETRTALELETYPHVVGIARDVIREAFSNQVITPGVTTTADVAWFIRQRFEDLGLDIWFMPSVDVQRRRSPGRDRPNAAVDASVIRPGDVLHCDVGIDYLRMSTDTQEMGYVLGLGEEEVPSGLVRALAVGNRWQDLLTGSFRDGLTGNQILAATIQACEEEGIVSSTYTHPIGYHGHGAGPTIGMWDNQGPTPLRGDWLLHPNTAYSIEGSAQVPVPEWEGQTVDIKLEQDAVYDGRNVLYIGGRQTRWHVVR